MLGALVVELSGRADSGNCPLPSSGRRAPGSGVDDATSDDVEATSSSRAAHADRSAAMVWAVNCVLVCLLRSTSWIVPFLMSRLVIRARPAAADPASAMSSASIATTRAGDGRRIRETKRVIGTSFEDRLT